MTFEPGHDDAARPAKPRYLKWGTKETPGPGYRAWEKWHSEPVPFGDAWRARRPNVSWEIPPWAWKLYKERHPKPKPPPVPVQRNPFEGVGLFTAHDPRAALGLKVDWVLLKADGGDRADPAIGDEFRARGVKVGVWEAENLQGQSAVERYGAELYVAQDEGPGQREAANEIWEDVDVPCGLISNLWSTWLPRFWDCIIVEAYWNTNPNASPGSMFSAAKNRGARDIQLCYGTYDAVAEGGGRKPLAEYRAASAGVPAVGWSCYLAENLTPEDRALLS